MSFHKYIFVFYIMLHCSFIGYGKAQPQDIQSNLERGMKLQKLAKFDSALYYYNQALNLAYQSGDHLQQSYISKLKGTNFIYMGQFDSALYQLNKSKELAIELACDTIQAVTNLNIGYILLSQGKTDTAEILFYKSLERFKAIPDSTGMAKAYNLLTILHKSTGDYEEGIETALLSSYIFKQLGQTQNYIRSLINLGNIYEKLNDYDTAYSCYKMCHDLSLEYNNLDQALTTLINMAVIDYNNGLILEANGDKKGAESKYLDSKANYIEAIELSQERNDKQTLALCYSNMSNLLQKFNNNDEAREYLEKGLILAKELGVRHELVQILRNLGISYNESGNYQKAKQYYLEGLELAQQSRLKGLIEQFSSNLSGVYENTGDYKTALEYSKLSTIYHDSLYNEAKQKEIEKHKTNFEILHLQDLNQIKEIDKKRMRAERNVTFWTSVLVVVMLIGILIFFRMRARKNRVIANQKIQKLEDEKKLMAARSVLVGQEKERERIAQELHDSIGVLLSTASIHFSSVEASADKETSKMLKKANNLLKEAGKEVRQISHNMMPGVLSKFGLREAIEDLFDEVKDTGKIEIDLQLTCGDGRLPENMEIMLFRVIQELINNTLKHAQATKISFFISRDSEIILIDYMDNGIGFDENTLEKQYSLGVFGIRSRIDYLGGKIALTSEKGKGTKYAISVPLSEKI